MGRFKSILLLIFILLAGVYIFYYYSYKSNSLYLVGGSIAMAVGFFGLGLNWFSLRGNLHRTLEIIVWLIYSAVGIVLFITILIYKGEYERNMLNKRGVKVKAIVIETKNIYNRGSSSSTATVQYIYDNKKYYQDVSNRSNYKLNDTVIMVCLPLDPEFAHPNSWLKY